jgi:hypothetical protein
MADSDGNFTIYYQNVRGLRTKTNSFFRSVIQSDYDIVCLTETWLLDGIYDGELFDHRYHVYRCDRDYKIRGDKMGGGVLIAVKCEFSTSSSSAIPVSGAAAEVIKISLRVNIRGVPHALHIYCCYSPHSRLQMDAHTAVFDSISDDILVQPNDIYLLVGDFNISAANWTSARDGKYMILSNGNCSDSLVSTLNTFLCFSSFRQFNNVFNSSDRLLDLIVSSHDCAVRRCNAPLVPEDSHHPALVANLLYAEMPSLCSVPHNIRMFKTADYESINIDLANIDWPDLFEGHEIDVAVSIFYRTINEIVTRHVPLKTFKNSRYPCWYSKSLIKIISEKLRFHKKWKLYGRRSDYNTFSLLRSRQKQVQLSCYDAYIYKCEQKIKLNGKFFWTFVNAKKSSISFPSTMFYDEASSSDGNMISNMFNSYFQSVYRPVNNECYTTYQSSSTGSSLSIGSVEISTESVKKYLKGLDISKGSGPDELPPIFFKMCHQTLDYPIWYLFNKSLTSGTMPATWKRSFVVPIFKSGDKHNIKNYRPISKLCTIAKLFEKIVYDGIYPILRSVIMEQQHGFINKKSTETNLCEFTHQLAIAMNDGYQMDVIYTDYSKAFDKISHSLLILKLTELGIHGDLLRWLTSYLRERSQAVTVKGYCSSFIPVTSGVPQGSHLGPLLFNLFINDISSQFSHSNILLYADDMKIFRLIKSSSDCLLLQNDLNNLCTYCSNNFIDLNIKKCNVISFTRKTKLILHEYNLNNTTLSRVTEVRDLGIYIDNKLSFNYHINSMTAKAYKMLGFILRTAKEFKHHSTLILLYFAFVRSILEYGSVIWNPQYKIYVECIERIQNKFIKHLKFKCDKDTKPRSIPSLVSRRMEKDQVFLYKILNGCIDSPFLLENIFLKCPRLNSRHRPMFNIPSMSTNYTRNTFLLRSCYKYNSNLSSLDIFNSKLRAYKRAVAEKLSSITIE